MEERRRYYRLEATLPLKLFHTDADFITETINISCGGACLRQLLDSQRPGERERPKDVKITWQLSVRARPAEFSEADRASLFSRLCALQVSA